MFGTRWLAIAFVAAGLAGGVQKAQAGDLKIILPRHSQATPVQRFNREGVDALRKHDYKKAESLFCKAYLLDPEDPFTLNNLGYISEMKGELDRAQRLYSLATRQATDAVIDVSTAPHFKGRPLDAALANPDLPLRLDHANVEALQLLSLKRAPEADMLLQRARKADSSADRKSDQSADHKDQKSDPKDVFTLINLGVAKEMEGESEQALQYYDAAVARHSNATAVITADRAWRGKSATEIAEQNARALRRRIEATKTPQAQAAEFSLRGVSAISRNEPRAADEDFRKAYAVDPNNAFALNNIGYVSEREGDRETAQVFYQSARKAPEANARVALASRESDEGLKLTQVAAKNDAKVEDKIADERAARRRRAEPILLRRRDQTIVEEPASLPSTPQSHSPQSH